MRFQKSVLISTMVVLNFSSAFSQTGQKSSEEFFRANSARSAADDKLAEILRKKQAELDAKESAARGVNPRPAEKSPVPASPRQPVASTAPATPAWTTTTEDRLEEALRQKQAELDAKENAAPQRPAIAQPSAVRVAPPATEPKPSKPVVQPAVNAAAEDRLVEALRKKQAELDAKEGIVTARSNPATAVTDKEREESEKRIQKIEAEIKAKEAAIQKRAATQPDASAKKTEAVNAALQAKTESKAQVTKNRTSKYQIPEAPASDLTTKEGRLADLLRRYKADEITPHDYHLERAKIIAEP